MYKLLLFIISLAPSVWAATMNFEGHFRGESTYYSKLNLGASAPVQDSVKTFMAARALLEPNLIIDDHFSLYSQWSLLTSPTFTPNGTTALGNGQGAYVLGDDNTSSLVLSRAWLEWTSDFGVLRVGRAPVSWGFGVLYDAGDEIWDDFQSTLDRLEYRLHLGNVIGAVAYSKSRKGSVLGSDNDQQFYTIFLQYDNPKLEVEGGLLYEKQVRSSSQQDELLNQTAFDQAAVLGLPSGSRTPFPLSNNVLDGYFKKTTKYFTFGGEVSWISGDAVDYNANNVKDDLNAFALLATVSYHRHKFKAFAEVLYASGDSDLNDNSLDGFVLLHRNRRPGLILGRELLGSQFGNTVGQGSHVAYSATDTYSGVLFIRPGVRVDWSPSWATGLEVVIAQKAAVPAGAPKNLGVELDLGLDHQIYKNTVIGLNIGYLFPGDGLGITSPKGPFAARFTLGIDI